MGWSGHAFESTDNEILKNQTKNEQQQKKLIRTQQSNCGQETETELHTIFFKVGLLFYI